MAALLTFSGAVRHDPAIERWLADIRDPLLAALARRWFASMRDCGPDVRELLHDGYATACVSDAPFGYVGAFTSHVNVGFFHGSSLADPQRLLQGTGKSMRHVKLRPGVACEERSLERLIDAGYRDVRARLAKTS